MLYSAGRRRYVSTALPSMYVGRTMALRVNRHKALRQDHEVGGLLCCSMSSALAHAACTKFQEVAEEMSSRIAPART